MKIWDFPQAVDLLYTEWDLGKISSMAKGKICAWINYESIPKELKGRFDGEISILLVNQEYRGKGYGKKLLQEVFELAKKDGIKNLQIITDESCNYEFYDKLNCKKIYEKTVRNEEPYKVGSVRTEQAFIYEKVFE